MDESVAKLMDSIKTIQYEYRKTDSLVSYARNPRKNDHLVEKFAAQIREFGMPVPICITPDGSIVDGHLRFKAAKFLGLPEVPVAVNSTWTKAQIKAFRISVNQTATWADWDNEYLKLELSELEEDNYDLMLTGFSPKELNQVMGEVDFDDAGDEEGSETTSDLPDESEASHVKMIQLFYNQETEENFRQIVELLRVKFKTESISDTVYAALEKLVYMIEEHGLPANDQPAASQAS